MVEAYANSVEDRLIDGLTFKLNPGASYINERKFSSFFASGSNIYNPTQGTKLIRIALTGKDWADPNTFRVMFDVENMDTTPAVSGAPARDPYLRPVSGPWSMFRRVRLLSNNQLIEDIDYYNRCHELFEILSNGDSRLNESVEGFGYKWDEHATNAEKLLYNGIAPGQKQTVCFKPLLGLLNQPKLLPLEYIQSLVLEMELVDDPAEAVMANVAPFTAENNSLLWQLSSVKVLCDIISLDNSVQESYHQVLMTSKEIPIHYNCINSQFQNIQGQDQPFINISRAVSRLKTIFVSLDKNMAGARVTCARKWWNDFYSTASARNLNPATRFVHNENDEFEMSLTIGSKTYPDGGSIRGHSEAYYQLGKSLGIASSKIHSIDINSKQYHDNRFVIGVDTEKSIGSSFTGISLKNGDLMSVKFKYKNPDPNIRADRIHIISHSDNVMQIHLTGVTVYE